METAESRARWASWTSTRDPVVRDELLLQYVPLVKYVAGRVRAGLPRSVESADVVSEGMIGLIDALDRFEPERGLEFPTFAVPRIRGAILDAVRAADWVPRSVRSRVREVEAARTELRERLGREAQDGEVADHLGLGVEEVRLVSTPRTAVGYATTDDLDGLEPAGPALDDALEDEEARAALLPAVRTLPQRDQVVLALYYFEGLTLADIGRVLGVTESRVSQLRSRAVSLLREALR